MTRPFFSVIIPAYNADGTIRSTIASVLAQSETDFEIIVVDDGSSDGTLTTLLSLTGLDQRLRIVSIPNGGVSQARNYGASLAKGELLAFLDADDQWACEKLARHRALHKTDPALDASFAQVQFCADQNGRMVPGRSSSTVPAGHLDVADIVVENAICTTSNFVVARDSFADIGGFDVSMRHAEDQELFARLLGFGSLIRGIDEPLVRYRMSEDGLSRDFEAMLEGWKSFAGYWLADDELAQAEATYCRYLARRALRSGADIAVARDFARRGLEAHRDTFMAGGLRSAMTLGGALAGAALPARLRRAVFA